MPYIPNEVANTGLYIPTTQMWDVQQLYDADIDPKLRELLVRMYQNLFLMANTLNQKDSALYMNQDFMNGQLFFNPASNSPDEYRPDFRKVIDFGALPNSVDKPIAHGLTFTADTTPTRIYGAAINPLIPRLIPLPYPSVVPGANIELWVDGTDVHITTTIDYSMYTRSLIVIEYLKN